MFWLTIFSWLLTVHPPSSPQDVIIDEVRPLFEGNVRPGMWHPVEITLSSRSPFTGTVSVITDTPVRYSRAISMEPHQRNIRMVIPVIFYSASPVLKVQIDGSAPVIHEFKGRLNRVRRDDLLVGVASTADLPQAERCTFFRMPVADLSLLSTADGLEAVNVLILPPEVDVRRAPLEEWTARGGKIYRDPDELLKDDANRRGETHLRINGLDPDLYEIVKPSHWRQTQKEAGFFFISTYLFAVMACYGVLLLRGIRTRMFWMAPLLVAAVTSILVIVLFPSGSLVGSVHEIRLVNGPVSSFTIRLTSVQAFQEGPYPLTFHAPVKPVHWEPPYKRSGLDLQTAEGKLAVTGLSMKKGEFLLWGDVSRSERKLEGLSAVRAGDRVKIDNRTNVGMKNVFLLGRGAYQKIGPVPSKMAVETVLRDEPPEPVTPWAAWLRAWCAPGRLYLVGTVEDSDDREPFLSSPHIIDMRTEQRLLMVAVEGS